MSYQDVEDVQQILEQISVKAWLAYSLGSWQWWTLLVASIVPWLIWWRFVDKDRGRELLTYGVVFSLMALILDNLGTFFNFWGYNIKLLPLTVNFFSGNCSVFPVVFMFMCQLCKSWKTFVISSVIIAAVFSYICEPLFIVFNMYRYSKPWSHTYSFIRFVLVFSLVRWTVRRIHKHLR
ncbi:hypothetical protein BK138_35120 [Paenibacillus rhizosphaerae]|uniref:Uncharacterized protein n=1 Tax=Paenibacillus rhizosphaerae TaxID=297318 RepID=A0A1R1DWT6_9BACL|nr:hypothetical protein BK138_35120 [Paenibacillus rhizosphaerae]